MPENEIEVEPSEYSLEPDPMEIEMREVQSAMAQEQHEDSWEDIDMTLYEGIDPAEDVPLPHYVSNPNDDDYYDSSPNIVCSADFRTLPEERERELRLQREEEEAAYLSSLADPVPAHMIVGIPTNPVTNQPTPLHNPLLLAAADPAPPIPTVADPALPPIAVADPAPPSPQPPHTVTPSEPVLRGSRRISEKGKKK